jgi:hypothetical protein
MLNLLSLALLGAFATTAICQTVTPVHLKVNTLDVGARNKTAPNLYGLFFEDINVRSNAIFRNPPYSHPGVAFWRRRNTRRNDKE